MDKKPFYIDEVRYLLNQYNSQQLSISKLCEKLNDKAAGFYGFGPAEPTGEGHETIKLKAIEGFDIPEWIAPVRYTRSEYDHQIKKMKKLGINTDSQFFEQCVNTLFFMIENKVWTLKPDATNDSGSQQVQ